MDGNVPGSFPLFVKRSLTHLNIHFRIFCHEEHICESVSKLPASLVNKNGKSYVNLHKCLTKQEIE